MNSISKMKKKIFMARVAYQSKKSNTIDSLRKRALNNLLKMKIASPYIIKKRLSELEDK